MRIAIVTESFAPDVNGVANSVIQVAQHLVQRGHEPLVFAPQPAPGLRAVAGALPYPVLRVPSVPMPGYRQVRLGMLTRRFAAALREHRPDVVHLASPFTLGSQAVPVARALDVPMVAVFQTDVAAYARVYHVGPTQAAAWRLMRRLHDSAARTLAPSAPVAATLHARGFQRIWLWRRGVDSTGFHPTNRSETLRRALAPDGAVLVGYVGRLAPEKRVDLLHEACRLPGVRVVVVGAGPDEAALRRRLPDAVFLGQRRDFQLARLFASLDVFVHTGPFETFGQTVQEAMASGLPVVAPAAGGPLDLVQPGVTGHLVPPDDAGALAAAVADLVAEPGRRAAFGAAGRAAVESRTWTAVGDELIGHYQAVRSGDSSGQPVAVSV